MTILAIILVAIISFVSILNYRNKKTLKLPPGPRRIPIVGNALSVGNDLCQAFGKWARIFGDIFTVNIFGKRIIVISEINLAREAYNHPSLLGRAYMEPFEVYFRGDTDYPNEVARGVLGSEGAPWDEQRRFTVRHLRDFGFGKQNYMEELIQAETSILMSNIQNLREKATDLWRPFALGSSNVMWRIIAGERITQNEEESRTIERATKYALEQLDSPLAVFLPWIPKWLGISSGWNNLVEAADGQQKIFHNHVRAHEKAFSPENSPRDFMDVYLKKISETTDTSSSFYGQNGVDSLKLLASDLFIAASESTAATLIWAVLYLTTWPEIQQRLFDEILDVIGNTREPSLNDRAKMPFTEAIINETLRKSSFTALGVMHRATEDTELRGYTIPKDSWVCVNQYYIHHDPKVWGDPENFRPERFLTTSSDGTVSVKKYEELIPFSIGKRVCIGDKLAKDEIFMFLCTIYQKYSTEFDPASPTPGLEARTVVFRRPALFNVVLKERK